MNNANRFEILEHLGKIHTYDTGWNMELNIARWDDLEDGPVYDIRSWSPDHERLTRGLRLTEEEMENLVEAYEEEFLEDGILAADKADRTWMRIGDDYFYVKVHLMVARLSEKDSVGYTRRLCVASWSGNAPKFDIRMWSDSFQHFSRGLTIVDDEMKALVKAYREKNPKKEEDVA